MARKNEFRDWVERVDEGYSKIFFESSLPKPVEALFSIPGNWFGLPTILLVGPLWICILLGETPNQKLLVVALAITLPLLALWFSFLLGNTAVAKKVFVGKPNYFVFPVVAIALCWWLIGDDDPALFSLAVYPIWLWIPSLIVVIIGKGRALRRRPCANPKYASLISRKQFPILPRMLANVAAEGSFPSGDAAGAMAFGITIALGGRPDIGGIIMFLACAGRVYFLAHHVFDTIAGSLVTLAIHYISSDVFGMPETGLSWWQPLIMVLSFGLFMFTIGRRMTNTR